MPHAISIVQYYDARFCLIHKLSLDCTKTQVASPIATFCLISSLESVRKMEEVGSLELILDWGPWRAGKKVEWSRAGLWYPKRGATSRVIRK